MRRNTFLEDRLFSRKEVEFRVFFSHSRRKSLTFNKVLSSKILITPARPEEYFSFSFDPESNVKIFIDRPSSPSCPHAHASDSKHVSPTNPSCGIDFDSTTS